MTKFVNLCGEHDVVVLQENGVEWVLPSIGKEARIFSDVEKAGKLVDNETKAVIPLVEQRNPRAVIVPAMDSFPDPEKDVWLVVSAVVREFFSDRTDLLSPDVGATAKRDEHGNVLYVRRFRKNAAEEEAKK